VLGRTDPGNNDYAISHISCEYAYDTTFFNVLLNVHGSATGVYSLTTMEGRIYGSYASGGGVAFGTGFFTPRTRSARSTWRCRSRRWARPSR
jgi:hypothetical protein